MNKSWYILCSGLEFEADEINIIPNLKIKKIKNDISIFDLAALGTVGFNEWSLISPVAKSCKFEIVSEFTSISGYDTLNRAWLLNTMLVLRNKLSIQSFVCSSYSWENIAGFSKKDNTKKLNPFVGNILDYHLNRFTIEDLENTNFNTLDLDWLKNHFEICNNLAAKNTNFRFALETITSWRYTNNLKSSIAILWAAIEGIIGVSSEIVFRLSLNIASVLEEKGNQRLEKFNDIKKLYGLRSKIVHGSVVKDEDMVRAVKHSFILLRDLITKMIENNHILDQKDFDLAIFY